MPRTKLFSLLLATALTTSLTSCGKDKTDSKDYQQFVNNVMAELKENLPDNFTYEETKQDGMVVLENIRANAPLEKDSIKESLRYATGVTGVDIADNITELSINIDKLTIDPANKIVISNLHYSGAYNKDPHQLGLRNVVVSDIEFGEGESKKPHSYNVKYSNPYATGTYADLGRTMVAAFAKSSLPDPKIWDNLEQAFTDLSGNSTVSYQARDEAYAENGVFNIPGLLAMSYDVQAAGLNEQEVETAAEAFTAQDNKVQDQLQNLTAILNNAEIKLEDEGLLANYIKPVLADLPQLKGKDPIGEAVAALTELENKPIKDDDLTPEYKKAMKQMVSFAKEYLQGNASSITVKLSPSKDLAPTTAVAQQLENFQENYGISVSSK